MSSPWMPSKPKLLVLWVTTDCNLRCRYCYAEGGDLPERMAWAVAAKAPDSVAQHTDSFEVQFSGEEGNRRQWPNQDTSIPSAPSSARSG